MQVTVILPPWLQDPEAREALVRTGAHLGAPCQALGFSGRACVEALAARVGSLLDGTGPQLVLLPAGTEGEQACAHIAASLGGCTLGNCSAIEIDGTSVLARRPIFGGRAEITVRSHAEITCATVRAEADMAPPASQPEVRAFDIDEPGDCESEPVAATAKLPRVEGAAIVVSGGRGVDAPEGFELLARIAHALGAGLAGSLPAVDAGRIPVAHQVGQSGKFVAPRVYFAVGISGTPQHLAGVSPNARIIALNSDPDAPIFSRCDVAVLGDWREILPRLADELDPSAVQAAHPLPAY